MFGGASKLSSTGCRRLSGGQRAGGRQRAAGRLAQPRLPAPWSSIHALQRRNTVARAARSPPGKGRGHRSAAAGLLLLRALSLDADGCLRRCSWLQPRPAKDTQPIPSQVWLLERPTCLVTAL